jgi:hypothetical protein
VSEPIISPTLGFAQGPKNSIIAYTEAETLQGLYVKHTQKGSMLGCKPPFNTSSNEFVFFTKSAQAPKVDLHSTALLKDKSSSTISSKKENGALGSDFATARHGL